MRPSLFLLLAVCGCATVRNAPPASPTTAAAKPIAAFLSPSLHTSISLTSGEGDDRNTTMLTLRMGSGRVAFALMKDSVDGGRATHPMQALVLPEDALDVAELEKTVCTLKRNATVTCVSLDGEKKVSQFSVDPDAKRLLLLAEDKRCVLRETGAWSCYSQEFDHPWTANTYASDEMNKLGLGAAPVPDSRCFLTRDQKLFCYDEDVLMIEQVLGDVEVASVDRGRGDFSGGCAVRKDASVACWTRGINETGVLGNGKRGPASGPQTVVGVEGAIAVAREPEHACALTRAHDVYCWGSADGYAFGEAAYEAAIKLPICGAGESPGGNNCITSSPFDRTPHQRVVLVPRLVPELHGVTSIAVGYERTCGVRADGRLLCLGAGHPGAWSADLDTAH